MPQSKEKATMDRTIMQGAIETAREMIPNTEFIMIGVEPDGTEHGYFLKVVTSITPEVSIEILERALQAAVANLETFKANTEKLNP